MEKKNGLEDLKKAQWYLNKLIDTVEQDCSVIDVANDELLLKTLNEVFNKEESKDEDA